MLKYSSIINILGGSLVLAMGVCMIFRKNKEIKEAASFTGGIKLFLSSFAVGITNPAAGLRCIHRHVFVVGRAFHRNRDMEETDQGKQFEENE